MRSARILLATTAALAVSLVACSAPGAAPEPTNPDGTAGGPPAGKTTIDQVITPEAVAELGDITLDVLADAGEEATMKTFVPAYESMYPNVKLNIEYRSYDDIIKTEVNTLDSDNPPDLAQGAQGYALDGTLVGAGLIRPLDDLAAAYDWSGRFGDATLSEFRWSDDGKQFGTGSVYGLAPVVSIVGVYYNQTKLEALGLKVPETFAEFEQSLKVAKDAGEQPIMLGNAAMGAGLHVFGVVQGQSADPAATREWISGSPSATFVNESNQRTADTIQGWAGAGYFGEGYNGVAEDDAVGRFASGTGLYLIGGTWQATAIANGDQKIGFFAMPPGDSGLHIASGSMGMGWHISAKSEKELAAGAFIALITSEEWAQKLADIGRVPVLTTGVTVDSPLFQNTIDGSGKILKDGGITYSFDWATGTMMQTMGGALQELMDNRIQTADFLDRVQADWQAFQDAK